MFILVHSAGRSRQKQRLLDAFEAGEIREKKKNLTIHMLTSQMLFGAFFFFKSPPALAGFHTVARKQVSSPLQSPEAAETPEQRWPQPLSRRRPQKGHLPLGYRPDWQRGESPRTLISAGGGWEEGGGRGRGQKTKILPRWPCQGAKSASAGVHAKQWSGSARLGSGSRSPS